MILTEAGLAAAVRSLADTAPVPVLLDASTDARFAPAVERAAYTFVATTIEAATHGGTEELLVRLLPKDGRLLVEVTGAQDVPVVDLEHVSDRLGAVGGHLTISSGQLVAALPIDGPPLMSARTGGNGLARDPLDHQA